MNTTIFIAQIWGPILVAIGIGFFLNKPFYVKLYKDIQNEPLATLTFGIFSMVVGFLQISIHSTWDSFNQGLITFLGWATLVKGAVFLAFPGFVDKAADWEAAKKLVGIAGSLVLIIGVYITWVGYFA